MGGDCRYVRGARRILDTSLGLKPGQEVLVVIDETTTDLAGHVADAATTADIDAAFMLHPIVAQRSTRSPSELPRSLVAAVREPNGVLICVNGSSECLAFRTGVFQLARSNGVKTGHLPGMTVDILPFADADYDTCSRLCYEVASVLGRGSTAEIVTYDPAGRDYHLSMKLQGWEVPPLVFDSIIQNATWENIPTGEAFACPAESSADGQIYINGSVPGCVIADGEGVLLTFRGGRLQSDEIDGSSHDAIAVIAHEKQFALGKKDTDWDQLAELGIGVNSAVDRLLGIALSDEKMLGTIHIAIGNNRFFGGDIDSEIHCDMVTRNPDLIVDGSMLMTRGVLSPSEWAGGSLRLPPRFSVVRKTGDFRIGVDGNLQREWKIVTGKTCCIDVARCWEDSVMLDVLEAIPPAGEVHVQELMEHLRLSEEELNKPLQLLLQFGIVGVG